MSNHPKWLQTWPGRIVVVVTALGLLTVCAVAFPIYEWWVARHAHQEET